MTSPATENPKHKWFRLKKSTANGILIYLSILTLASITLLVIISIPELNPLKGLSIFSFSIIASLISGLLGASLFYFRKLYRACISQDMLEPNGSGDDIRQMGIVFYYISRPLYSACLSFIACIATKSGTEFITHNGEVNENFPYLIIILSFFVGFSSSDFIDYLETRGKKVVTGVFNNDNN